MSTADEVRDHNEQVLRNIDRVDRVHKYFKSIGSTDEQAATAAAAHADKFVWNGATLEFQGKPVADPDNGVREFFEKNKLDFLFPPKSDSTKQHDVDPQLLASARAGNQTARTQIYKQLGDLEATDALIAEKPAGNKTKDDASTNPWRSANFRTDIAAQKRAAGIIKALGTSVAASMAKSAGKTLTGTPLRA
jgi:hypothetical protein